MPANFLSRSQRHACAHFPALVSETDLVRYFKLSKRDFEQLAPLRGSHNRFGFALGLCSIRYLGFCPDDLLSAPQPVIHYLAQQLQLDPAALNRYGHRPQTARRHRQAAEQYLGFLPCSQTSLAQLQAWLLNRALEHDKPTLLLELAVQKLYQDKLIRPGISLLALDDQRRIEISRIEKMLLR